MSLKTGKVYLAGGGCGDSRLLTLKALEVLRSCDTVIYDSLVSDELLKYTKDDCEKIYVGKRYGTHAMKQSEINDLLIEKAREGKNVVRLKGGDPYVFGRGGEEFLAMREAGIYCEEIPGISSAIAVPAAAGIPVTHRGLSSSVTVVTGTAAEEDGHARLKMDFDTLARLEGTLVILMGMHHLKEITDGLMMAGKSADTPCAVIMDGTTGRQRCLRTVLSKLYAEASGQGFTSPSVIVIGAVAVLKLAAGREDGIGKHQNTEDQYVDSTRFTVGVTGTPHFVEKVTAALEQKPAGEDEAIKVEGNSIISEVPYSSFEVWDMGFMEICSSKNPLPDMKGYEWIVFTSPNGVRVFLDKMRQERKDLRVLCGKRIAVIGPGTARVLEENGIYADYIPEVYDAEHLAKGLARRILMEQQEAREEKNSGEPKDVCGEELKDACGNHVSAIFMRAKQGSDMLPRIFAEKGLSYCEYPLYELGIQEEKRIAALTKTPDYIVFGSAMGARAYFEGMEQAGVRNDKSRYVCIGERCGEELRKYMEREYLVAKESSVEAVAACIRMDAIDNK